MAFCHLSGDYDPIDGFLLVSSTGIGIGSVERGGRLGVHRTQHPRFTYFRQRARNRQGAFCRALCASVLNVAHKSVAAPWCFYLDYALAENWLNGQEGAIHGKSRRHFWEPWRAEKS